MALNLVVLDPLMCGLHLSLLVKVSKICVSKLGEIIRFTWWTSDVVHHTIKSPHLFKIAELEIFF